MNALLIDIGDDSVNLPNVLVHSLFLWSDSKKAHVYMSGESKVLRIWSWLMFRDLDIGIGWWSGNKIENGVDFTKVIGWWENNKVFDEMWVVVWWRNNIVNNMWVVIWWDSNKSDESGIVLGWYKNVSKDYGLPFWSEATAQIKSFSWNSSSVENQAVIEAASWVLIWTYNPVTGVNLVVNWAVKIWWKKIEEYWEKKGEIRWF